MFALAFYFLLCVAISVGVLLYVAFPGRGRDLPERVSAVKPRLDRSVQQAREAVEARRGTEVRRDREAPQRS